MSWSREHTANFIDIYRDNECIWKVKSNNYHNKGEREAAYKTLLDYVHTFEPSATKDTLVKKINNLRSTFRKEQKKVMRSLKAVGGRRSVNIYEPKWSHYDQLLFLLEKDEEALEGSSCLEDDTEHEKKLGIEATPDDLTDTEPRPEEAQQDSSPRGNYSFKRSRHLSPGDQILHSVGKRLADVKQKDHLDSYAKSVAHKLRLLGNEQRIYAQKLINDALFEAELGCLTRYASIDPGSSNS